jgi:AbrB family looped-hinge helix DNA binding protein
MSEIMIVSTKGQITLPLRVRAKFGIKAGDRIIGEEAQGGFIIKKPLDFFSLRGSLSGGEMSDDEEDLLTPDIAKHIMERI